MGGETQGAYDANIEVQHKVQGGWGKGGTTMSRMKDVATDLRNRYMDMTVHELVCELAELGTAPVERFDPIDEEEVEFIEFFLRRAVIREATVERVSLEVNDAGDNMELVGPKWLPVGHYVLVKEAL